MKNNIEEILKSIEGLKVNVERFDDDFFENSAFLDNITNLAHSYLAKFCVGSKVKLIDKSDVKAALKSVRFKGLRFVEGLSIDDCINKLKQWWRRGLPINKHVEDISSSIAQTLYDKVEAKLQDIQAQIKLKKQDIQIQNDLQMAKIQAILSKIKEDKMERENTLESVEIPTPTQEEIDYVKEMISETGKVNIKYLMDMTDYSFEVVVLSRALLEKDGFLEEPKIKDKAGLSQKGFDDNDFSKSKGMSMHFFAHIIAANLDNQKPQEELLEDERLNKKILTLMRDKDTTNIDTISKILRADWNKVALFRANLEGNIITEPKIAKKDK